jgi:hypothetical protein
MNSTEKAQVQEEEIEIIEGDPPEEDHGGEEGQQEDERLSDSRNDEEDARRQAKREERQRRKQNQKYARDKTREEMQWLMEQNQALQQRLEAIENQAISFQKGSLDQNYNQALHGVKAAENALAKAIEVGDGSLVPELLRQRDMALAKAAEINRAKQNVAAPAPATNTIVNMKARQWAAENPWFNANSADPDSQVAKAIDASLVAEGLDPASDRYWDELNSRVAKYLPHRFAEDDDEDYTEQRRPGRRGPPVGGSREMAPGKTQVYLTPERVNALKDAGAWDDPVRRKEMLRRFAEWDRQNKAAR